LTAMFDPETGQIIPLPNPYGAPQGQARTSRKGLLIKHDSQANRTELVGMNGVMTQESRADQWNEISNLQALETLRRNYMSEGGSVGAAVSGEGTHTFLFKTESGRIGLLQITGLIENPRGVKIRYKLVQPAAPKSPTPSVAPIVPKIGFIRAPGEYPLDVSGSVLSIPQDGLNRNIAFVIKWAEGSAQDSISVSGKPFFARPGAFAYIESAKRVWMFDGGKQLDLVTPTGRNSVAATAPFDSWPKDVSAALPGAFRENLLNPYSSAQPASSPVERFASPAPTKTPGR
jgi:hypothetical protein